MTALPDVLLRVEGLGKTFASDGHAVMALQGVTLSVRRGECHAIVGESGSGKTTLGNLILGLVAPTTGHMVFDGALLPARRTPLLRRRIQLVQQNPLSALNPRRSIGASIRLPLDVHAIGVRSERRQRVRDLLAEVGLEPDMAGRSPAALSGGQRQRVAIARALAAEPDLIVFDEPTSALDVLVQARVLALLDRLRRERRLTYLFISHDLAVVRTVAAMTSIFARGELVESGDTAEIFRAPKASFTRALLGAVPVVTDEEARLRDEIRTLS